ncbi:MAG: ATP-binding cassette domain-containing protein [Flavobacteriales bacterium]|jgi:ABC-2 type transport system ATP-binding protein|tara:strand:- start:105 stop:806 length:702 start_codon:yes stop_codon:yes gene_type:complete
MSLEIKNISKKYKTQIALSNICFSLKKGDIVGFLGPNGAGKTTLMKIITSTLKQDMGSVSINGLDTIENELDTKAQIGYLAENNPLYNEMYVTEYLDFIASIYNLSDKKQKIESIINKTGLDLEKSKKIEQLSKGYKQRVGLAAALVHNPDILILDEPTTGLDPNQLVEIRNLIKETGKDKIVLLSTHIMQEIPKICNKIIIINKGKIVDNRDMDEFNSLKLNLEDHFQKLTS